MDLEWDDAEAGARSLVLAVVGASEALGALINPSSFICWSLISVIETLDYCWHLRSRNISYNY